MDEGMADGAYANKLAVLLGVELPRCCTGTVSLLVTVVVWIVARAATA